MTPFETAKRRVQINVAVAALVPTLIGFWGVATGLGSPGTFADSHYRYLSGLLLGIGLAFLILVPAIERQGWPFRLLAGIVVLGGLARLGAALAGGVTPTIGAALIMELIVMPLLVVQRERLERLSAETADQG